MSDSSNPGPPESVFVVQHWYEDETHEDVKMIGVFRTRQSALTAIQALRTRSGFSAYPDGFSVGEYPLDKTHWNEGFVGPTE